MKRIAGILVVMGALCAPSMAHGGFSISLSFGDRCYRPSYYRSYGYGYRPTYYYRSYGHRHYPSYYHRSYSHCYRRPVVVYSHSGYRHYGHHRSVGYRRCR